MEQLEELIFNSIEWLRNKKNPSKWGHTYYTINKYLTSVSMEKLKERLTIKQRKTFK